jgi:Rrf2 family protein
LTESAISLIFIGLPENDVKLTSKTRYGVRAVFDIAYHSRGGPTQAKDISRRQNIPQRYLEQIFQELKRAGLVDARRGPRGGYYLLRPAEQIRLGDVMRALQGPIEQLFAVEGEPGDVHTSLWRDLARKVALCFDEVTLRDLCERRDKQQTMYFI